MNITAQTNICIIVGDPVGHSFSPQMHNAAYEALRIDDQFIYVAAPVSPGELGDFVKGARAMHIKGITCTVPHKETIIQYLDSIDETAQKIGAVNTVVNENNVLKGYNTDWLGILHPLEKETSLAGKTVALLGSGGAARAAAYAVTSKGAKLMIYNRTLEKAQTLAKEFDAQAFSFDERDSVHQADIIINTTSMGLHPHESETPLPKEYITNKQIVFDVVYTGTGPTRLLEEAQIQGAKTISGIEMLLHQGFEQFRLFTGIDAPQEAMRMALMENLNKTDSYK